MFKKEKEECKCEPVNCFEDKVKCTTCLCWLDKKDAQIISYKEIFGKSTDYYCASHRKPYDRIIKNCYPPLYFKEVRVNEDGEPYGYIKVKEKNAN